MRKEQSQLERVRMSIQEEAKKIQEEKQNNSLPPWMSPRPAFEGFVIIPETTITDFDSAQSEILLPLTTEPTHPEVLSPVPLRSEMLFPSTKESMRRHSTL